VAPASSPVAAVDSDPATAWVSNSLQPALGQWLQIDFDRPVTNATLTITPSATAVGAQVRRIQVSTVNGMPEREGILPGCSTVLSAIVGGGALSASPFAGLATRRDTGALVPSPGVAPSPPVE
jgi:arabinofuranan 3-O-arabinosyltransferase